MNFIKKTTNFRFSFERSPIRSSGPVFRPAAFRIHRIHRFGCALCLFNGRKCKFILINYVAQHASNSKQAQWQRLVCPAQLPRRDAPCAIWSLIFTWPQTAIPWVYYSVNYYFWNSSRFRLLFVVVNRRFSIDAALLFSKRSLSTVITYITNRGEMHSSPSRCVSDRRTVQMKRWM